MDYIVRHLTDIPPRLDTDMSVDMSTDHRPTYMYWLIFFWPTIYWYMYVDQHRTDNTYGTIDPNMQAGEITITRILQYGF